MKLDALDHPKTFDFAARLGIELPTALGHLELLWAFTGKQSPQGDIGKWPDGSIARACYWMGDPAAFMRALEDAGFLDHDPQHRLLIHDWPEHAQRWVRAKLKKLGKDFIPQTTEATVDATTEPSKEGKPSQGKGREEKGEGAAVASPPPPVESEPTPTSFMADWNAAVPFSPIRSMSEPRKAALRARRADPGWRQDWQSALGRIRGSPFLRGENDRNWKADADWFLRPDTVTKILEGKYDGNGKATARQPTRIDAPDGKYDSLQIREG